MNHGNRWGKKRGTWNSLGYELKRTFSSYNMEYWLTWFEVFFHKQKPTLTILISLKTRWDIVNVSFNRSFCWCDIQYIPSVMHIFPILLCFDMVTDQFYIYIVMLTPLALGNATEVSLTDMEIWTPWNSLAYWSDGDYKTISNLCIWSILWLGTGKFNSLFHWHWAIIRFPQCQWN